MYIQKTCVCPCLMQMKDIQEKMTENMLSWWRHTKNFHQWMNIIFFKKLQPHPNMESEVSWDKNLSFSPTFLLIKCWLDTFILQWIKNKEILVHKITRVSIVRFSKIVIVILIVVKGSSSHFYGFKWTLFLNVPTLFVSHKHESRHL